jgi:hypothetical protein
MNSEDIMILDEKHQKVAIDIVQTNRTKKSCNKCYDRGYIGFAQDKTVVPCEKCVDLEKAFEGWKEYVSQHDDLKEYFKDLFVEDEKSEEEETEESKEGDSQTKAVPIQSKKEVTKPAKPARTNHPATNTSAVRKTSGRGK